MSNFAFLQAEFSTIYESANKAVDEVHPDPRTACFYARRALELTVNWLYKYDDSLELPYQDNLSSLIHEPTFKNLVGEAIFNKARVIIKLGNLAVHSARPISVNDAINAVRELFHVTYWLVHTYGRSKQNAGLTFNSDALPKTAPVPKQTIEQLQKLETQLHDRDEKLSTLLADKNALDEELKQLRVQLAAVKKASVTQPDT